MPKPKMHYSRCTGEHTPSPNSYIAWRAWEMRRSLFGWTQTRCPQCNLLAVWHPPGPAVRTVVRC